MILAEELVFGERLPTEPELCRLFGVSRTVVREAVRSLASKGLLEVRQGGGTTVRFPDVAQASELLTIMLRSSGGDVFRLVHEVRTLLEVEIAGLAAERRTEADLAMLERRLQQTREPALDHAQWARADVELHQTIALATHNPLHAVLLNSMAEMLMVLRITAAQLEDTPLRANHHHERIANGEE